MERKCPMCGAPMEGNVCGYCGYKGAIDQVEQATSQQNVTSQSQIIINNQNIVTNSTNSIVSKKSKITALLLCIFLGEFGAHRFYVGKIWTGILYLFTGGLFCIGWIVDIVLIISGKFKDKLELPLK